MFKLACDPFGSLSHKIADGLAEDKREDNGQQTYVEDVGADPDQRILVQAEYARRQFRCAR
jgi:hypothetical protein